MRWQRTRGGSRQVVDEDTIGRSRARSDRRPLIAGGAATLAATVALAAGPLATTTDAGTRYITPNAAVVKQLVHNLQPSIRFAINAYNHARKANRATGIDRWNHTLRYYDVVVPARSNITGGRAEYIYEVETQRGARLTPGNTKEVDITETEYLVSLKRYHTLGAAYSTSYGFSAERDLASDYNSPSTPLEQREIDWAVGVGWGLPSAKHPNRVESSAGAGWLSYDYYLTAQDVAVTTWQLNQVTSGAAKDAPIVWESQLCHATNPDAPEDYQVDVCAFPAGVTHPTS